MKRRFAMLILLDAAPVLHPENLFRAAPHFIREETLMNKRLTRLVLSVTAMVSALTPVKANTGDVDSVSVRATRQTEGYAAEPRWRCGGWDGRPCNAYDEIESPRAARDGVIGEEVARWLDHWGTKGRSPVRGLKRMGRYEDYIDAELAARGLPSALRYLPLIEADYRHLAVSPAGAAGLWQLMPETARWLGLEVNSLVDQRFDVQAATGAALDYLAALHDRFRCWFLALAAYNAGPTRIERAIRRHGGARPRNDALFAHIRDRLPKETRDFIPKFLASVRLAGELSNSPGHAALEKEPPERFDEVRVEGAASADVLAAAAGITEDEIRILNPHLRIGLAPAGRSTRLRLPAGAGEAFLARFATIPVAERSTLREHTVAPGETLVRIARRYGVALDALRTVNPDVQPRHMQIGTLLVIPRGAEAVADGSRIATNPPGSRGDPPARILPVGF
ncbi:MAG: transglycosylase SLT domain-containing protein [Gemmatimonadota bacterium]|nr:transglycosylase SLT domain-containing protein [Gemmatimonadota bacterium]